jgi:glycosyltransferase involved in cell wall biosynthesis
MNIAFINDTFLEGRGADTVIYELARRLGKKHSVYVIAGETNIKEENFKFLKIDLPKLFTGKLKDFLYFRNMGKLHEQILNIKEKYNINIFNVYHVGLSPALDKLEIIYTWLGSPPSKNIFRNMARHFFEKKIIKNRVINISQYLDGRFKLIGGKNSRVILLGVSPEFKKTKKPIDKNYMLYVGRLEKHKNVSELIMLSKKINFNLKIVGYGTQDAHLKKLAKRISAPVEFIGRVNRKKLIKYYQECSFFVSASKWEGFGLIFIEAGACGKPSIGYNEGSISELIINGKTGFLANKFSELVKNSETLIENKNLRKKMGDEAYKFSKRFDWNKIVKEYEREFEK